MRAFEAPRDVIVYLGGTLPQIRPFLRVFEEAMLVGSFRAPDYTGGGTSRVKTGVGFVAFVGIAELSVDFRSRF